MIVRVVGTNGVADAPASGVSVGVGLGEAVMVGLGDGVGSNGS
jgi:hypothetical protein